MRRCRSTEQRLWLGPSGYPCSGRRRPNTFAFAHSDGNCYHDSASESDTYTERSGRYAYGDTYSDSYSDRDAKSGAKASAHAASAALKIG